MYFAEGFVCEMSVRLRGRDIGMTQKFLHGAEVGAVHQKIGRKTVPEFVRMNALRDAGFARAREPAGISTIGDNERDLRRVGGRLGRRDQRPKVGAASGNQHSDALAVHAGHHARSSRPL